MKKDTWSSQMGVILAVAGSAVGLGNFLKFPGQVALYGGASFMIAYVISFFVLGLPIAFVEWTVGRRGGQAGYYSPAGLMGCLWGSKRGAYIGILGVVLTTIIYCYYIYIEAWCLGYSYNFLAGELDFKSVEEASGFFSSFIGATADGSALRWGTDGVVIFWATSFLLNFYLIYRGVSKGIESFCKFAMPVLVGIAIIIVIRMMTLTDVSPAHPERTISQGMGFMWNPVKVVLEERTPQGEWREVRRLVGDFEIAQARRKVAEKDAKIISKKTKSTEIKLASSGKSETDSGESAVAAQPLRIEEISMFRQLCNPSIWIAAAGQVFFSLTVGFGAIMAYASHLKRKDDIVLSCLTSASANEFCEVCLGGMITVPAAIAFFGVSGAIGAGLSLFDLGFKVLPMFFASLPFGSIFGFLFFMLLFLAAVTSSLSMLQPGIAFIEEAASRVSRKFSAMLLGLITFFVSGFVMYFSKDLKAMDTFDFWMGQVTVYMFAMAQTLIFAWKFGAERGVRNANDGSAIKLPLGISAFVIKYITPTVLLLVFLTWLAKDVLGLIGDGSLSPYITDLVGRDGHVNAVAWVSIVIVLVLLVFYSSILYNSRRYKNFDTEEK